MSLVRALFIASLVFAAAACGSDDLEETSIEPETTTTPVGRDLGVGDGMGEGDVGMVALTVEPEGETFELDGACEFWPESNSGVLDDLAVEGVGVSLAWDNATDDTAPLQFNVTSETTVRDDGTFGVSSRGGVDNESVTFRGTGTAEIVESDGVIGRVAFELTMQQAGPATDPTGAPAFDDQPAERSIVGESVCIIGIR